MTCTIYILTPNINFVGAKIVNKKWNEEIFDYTASGVLAGNFYSDTPAVIDNVNVDATSSVNGVANVGGLIGNFQAGHFGSKPQMGIIKNSSNAASVTGADTYHTYYGESQKYDGINVGGIVGTGYGTLTNVSNSGIIKADGAMDIPNPTAESGNLYSASYAGGIAGQWWGYGDITYAANTGKVTGQAGMVGGIVGTAPANLRDPEYIGDQSGEYTNIAHAYNTGEISGTTGMVGGIVGAYIVSESTVDDANVTLEDVHTTKGGITNAIINHGATISGANNAAFLHVTGSHVGGSDIFGTKTDLATVQKNIDNSMGTNLQGLDVSKTGNLEIPDDPTGGSNPPVNPPVDPPVVPPVDPPVDPPVNPPVVPPVDPPVNPPTPPTPPIITPEELPEKIKEIINDGNANADVVGRVVVEAIVGSDKAENVVAEIDSATTAAAAEGKTTATVSTEDTTGNSVPAPAASDSGNGAAEEEKAVTFEG